MEAAGRRWKLRNGKREMEKGRKIKKLKSKIKLMNICQFLDSIFIFRMRLFASLIQVDVYC